MALRTTVITHHDDGTKRFDLYDEDGVLYSSNLFLPESMREPDSPWTVDIPLSPSG